MTGQEETGNENYYGGITVTGQEETGNENYNQSSMVQLPIALVSVGGVKP